MLRNKGAVVSKEAIIENVWDYDSEILPNTIEVFIGYLRKKIDKDNPGRELIHTVRGFGYKLENSLN
jgi:DNA-binding response OmpR family regulator